MSRPPEDICITSAFVDRYPIWSFIILCFAITWGVWFTIPVFAGDNWTLIKVLTGVGVGPGLAAVLLDAFAMELSGGAAAPGLVLA